MKWNIIIILSLCGCMVFCYYAIDYLVKLIIQPDPVPAKKKKKYKEKHYGRITHI